MRIRSLLVSCLGLALPAAHADPTWTDTGPDGGAVTMIATASGWLYAATTDGVFRSNDQGVNWNPASVPLPRDTYVTTVAVSPHNPSVVLAGGFGAIFRSADAGATWTSQAIAATPQQFIFNAYSLFPDEVFFIGSNASGTARGAAYWSYNAGAVWLPIDGPGGLPLKASALATDATADRGYALTDTTTVLRASGGGGSWTATGYVTTPASGVAHMPMLIDPFDNNALIMAAPGFDSTYVQRFAISTGTTQQTVIMDRAPGQLASDRNSPGRMWLSTGPASIAIELFESLDHGQTWGTVASDRPVRMLSADASVAGRLYGTTDAGPEVSEDAGRHWETRAYGLPLARSRGVSVDPRNPQIVLAATSGNGVWRSTDAGGNWERTTGLDHRAITAIARSAQQPDTLYAAGSPGFFKSVDAGLTWAVIPAGPGVRPRAFRLIVDRDDDSRLLASSNEKPYWSTDGGATWQEVGGLMVANYEIAASPSGGGRYYLMPDARTTAPYALRRADSHGAAVVAVGPAVRTFALGVHPRNDARLVALRPGSAGNASVHLSSDAGDSWQERGQVPLGQGGFGVLIRFDPCSSDTLFAATGDRVYRSDDLGLVWQQEPTLRRAGFHADLDVRCAADRLVVATASNAAPLQIRTSTPGDRILRGGFDG